uniref:GDT1 family protein n=1 Tax=Anopheles farauti TaxID=69004 RepID=A0A182QIY3_9DIPT
MSGKSVMNKFVIRNIAQRLVNCTYVCVFYLMLLCMLDTAGIGADKMPQEDISVVTEIDELAPDGSSGVPTDGKGLTSDIGFLHAFAASFMVIIVSELGDKTFFIAAIMAMRHPRLTVFAGAISALALMTVVSVVFGMAATLIPRAYTFYISTALFAMFGLKMLYDGYHMSATDAAEELEEVQSDLRRREDELARSMSGSRKETTVELVPLSDLEEADAKQRAKLASITSTPLPRRHGSNNGSIHSLGGTEQQQSSGPTLRLSASASQLDGTNAGNRGKPGISTANDDKGSLSPTSAESGGSVETAPGASASTGGGGGGGGAPLGLERDASSGGGLMVGQDAESGRRGSSRGQRNNSALKLLLRIFMQAFTMTFVAEWGDRSQLTTVILSARENVYGVIAGGIIGHSICTGLAVIGGRMIAQRISVRTVTLIGGVVFLLFALSALLFGPGEEEPVKVPIP